jgi:hypothetical protein
MFQLIIALLRKNQGRSRAEEGRAEEEGREENQKSCCISQDKGTKAVCEDQKDDYAGE